MNYESYNFSAFPVDCEMYVIYFTDKFSLSELSVTMSDVLVSDEPMAIHVNVKVNCLMDTCPGAASSATLGSPVHFNLLLKVNEL